MRNSRQLSKNLALFFTIVVCWLSIYLDYYLGWWSQAISGLHLRENFLDMKIVVNFADCFKIDGLAVYQPLVGDSIDCTGYQYGRTLLQLLNLLNISESSITLLANSGILASLIIITSVFFFFGYSKPSHFFVYFFLLAGAPFRLLLERGNFDLLILALVFLAFLAFSREKQGISFTLVTLAALIKFYAFGLLLLFPLFCKSKKATVIQFFGIICVGLLILRDLRLIQVPFVSTNYISFGAPWLGEWYDFSTEYQEFLRLGFSRHFWHFLGVTLLLATAYAINLNFRKVSKFEPDVSNYELKGLVVVFMGTPFLICYLYGMNYNYRLFFLIFAALATLGRVSFLNSRVCLFIYGALFISVWCTYPIGIMKIPMLNYFAQGVGNFGILFFTSIVLIDLLRILLSTEPLKRFSRKAEKI